MHLTSVVVVPLSVLSNWEKQVKEHCSPDAIKLHIYYGTSGRAVSAERLRKYDVVVTTYQVVTSEHAVSGGGVADGKSKKRKTGAGGLFDVPWKVSVAFSVIVLSLHETIVANHT